MKLVLKIYKTEIVLLDFLVLFFIPTFVTKLTL